MEMSTPAASPSPPAALPPSSNAEVAVGLLQVAVRPWAEVSVDGNVVGTTPLDRISLSPGVHRIRVQHPAYEPVERSVKIRSGETAKLTVDLPNESTRKQP
jgi:hypothetical protein